MIVFQEPKKINIEAVNSYKWIHCFFVMQKRVGYAKLHKNQSLKVEKS